MGVHLVPEEILLRQKRNWIIETFTIYENYSGSFPYYLGKVDIDPGLNVLQITGQGLDEEPAEIIEINEKSGRIFVLKPVDYEQYQILRVILSAKSKENLTQTKVGINFEIIDANDNPPIFHKTPYETTINESTLQGSELINVTATDNDMKEEYKKFLFSIDSVTPEPDDMEFFINKEPDFGNGTISFKGCLNREKGDKYTLIVKATDLEKPETLFSFTTVTINIEHGNRHLPEFTNQSGPVSVKEGQTDVILSRLQVKDEDTRGTKAWKAIYKIQGDENNNFGITTDPQTNEGLLRVNKELDYENESLKNIVITVENEIPYFTCKVMARNINGLWKIKTDPSSSLFSQASVGNGTGGGGSLSRYQLTVVVEDVNEPPVFDPVQPVSVSENVEVGHYMGTFVARDPDVSNTPIIRYFKAEDPANWFTVDPKTGQITTSSILDKESAFTKDGFYVITINAVDNGSPPQTGTTSLSIYIINENDNAPTLIVSTFDVCVNDESSWVNVTAVDPDEEPYGGPFSFHLLGDIENRWRIDPEHGEMGFGNSLPYQNNGAAVYTVLFRFHTS